MELREVSALAVEAWRFDKAGYPELERLFSYEVYPFVWKHILMHQVEAVGNMASIFEERDHSRKPLRENKEALIRALRKSLVNTLRLAEAANVSVETLEENIRDWHKRHSS
jgi:hypothetical protein